MALRGAHSLAWTEQGSARLSRAEHVSTWKPSVLKRRKKSREAKQSNGTHTCRGEGWEADRKQGSPAREKKAGRADRKRASS